MAMNKRSVMTFLGVFGVLLLAEGGFLFAVRYLHQSAEDDLLRSRDRQSVEALAARIRTHNEGIRSDLTYLARCASLRRLVEGKAGAIADLGADFLAFANSKPVYDQVRFFDAQGMEVVRVNRGVSNAVLVPSEQLQDKSKRYYFTDVIALPEHAVFVSPMDLNIEHGAVEIPHKPMIRYGTPVYDRSGTSRGVVLLNYLADTILSEVHGSGQALLNREGYWLAGGPPDARFAFMLDRDKSFASEHPELWQRLQSTGHGQYDRRGLLTYESIHPLARDMRSSTGASEAYAPSEDPLDASQYVWYAIVYRSPDNLDALAHELDLLFEELFAGYAAGALAVSLFLTMLLERWRMYAENRRRLERMKGVLETAGAVCHEINQPLTGLIGYAEMLQNADHFTDEERRKRLNVLLESGTRIRDITLRLQNVVRYETKEYARGERILDINAASKDEKENDA